jgi:hypothetical protein
MKNRRVHIDVGVQVTIIRSYNPQAESLRARNRFSVRILATPSIGGRIGRADRFGGDSSSFCAGEIARNYTPVEPFSEDPGSRIANQGAKVPED